MFFNGTCSEPNERTKIDSSKSCLEFLYSSRIETRSNILLRKIYDLALKFWYWRKEPGRINLLHLATYLVAVLGEEKWGQKGREESLEDTAEFYCQRRSDIELLRWSAGIYIYSLS